MNTLAPLTLNVFLIGKCKTDLLSFANILSPLGQAPILVYLVLQHSGFHLDPLSRAGLSEAFSK